MNPCNAREPLRFNVSLNKMMGVPVFQRSRSDCRVPQSPFALQQPVLKHGVW